MKGDLLVFQGAHRYLCGGQYAPSTRFWWIENVTRIIELFRLRCTWNGGKLRISNIAAGGTGENDFAIILHGSDLLRCGARH